MPSDDSAPCIVSDDSNVWDLKGLSITGEDWLYTTPDAVEFRLHLCAPVHSELWSVLPAGTSPDDVTAVVKTASGDRSIGSMNYALSVAQTEPPAPLLTLSGPACLASPEQKTETTIRFVCSHAESGPVLLSHYPSSVAVDQACSYNFEWATPEACPNQGSLDHLLGDKGAIAVFAGMLIVVGLAWLIGTLLYNRFILKLTGRDLLPTLPSFSKPSLPTLPSFLSRNKDRKPWTSFRSNSYSRVATTGDDEEEGLVGRFGLDSDEDEDEGEGDAHPLEGDSRVWRNGAAGGAEGQGGAAKGKGGNGFISL